MWDVCIFAGHDKSTIRPLLAKFDVLTGRLCYYHLPIVALCIMGTDNRNMLILVLMSFKHHRVRVRCAKALKIVNIYYWWLSHGQFCSWTVHWCEVKNTPFQFVDKPEALHASSLVDGICFSDLMEMRHERQQHKIHTVCKELLSSLSYKIVYRC